MKSFARYIILAPLAAGLAGPAMAQNIPAGQSCGGLFCDMGVVGHKVPVGPDGRNVPDTPETHEMIQAATPYDPTHLPCHDFVCGMFGHKDEDAPPPAPVAAVAPAPEEAPAKPVHKAHRKHVAKAAEATPTADATTK
jgi:hypothetical protein